MKTVYTYGFQGLHCIEKRSDTPGNFLSNHNSGQTKELENALVLLCRNSIIHNIHKQNIIPNSLARLPLPPLPPPMPHPTFQTPP